MPVIEIITKRLFDFCETICALAYNIKYIDITSNAKSPPNSSPIKANMKSECASGKLFDISPFPSPRPNKPPLANDSKDLFCVNFA